MSGPKTAGLQKKNSNDICAEEQPCSSVGASCAKIREAAYHRWQAAGCPSGDGVQFWLQAEAELGAETKPEGDASE